MLRKTIEPIIINPLGPDERSTARSSPETDLFTAQHIERARQFCLYPMTEIAIEPDLAVDVSFGMDYLWRLLGGKWVKVIRTGMSESNLLNSEIGEQLLKLRERYTSREEFIKVANKLVNAYVLEKAGLTENLVTSEDLCEGARSLLTQFGEGWKCQSNRRSFTRHGEGFYAILTERYSQRPTWDFRIQTGNGEPEYILRCPTVGVMYDEFLEPRKDFWYEGGACYGMGYRPMVRIGERLSK